MEYYAHVSNDGLRYQTVAEHLKGTASLCRAFAAVFDAGEYGELAGLAHDMGKCTEGFQNRLLHDGPKVDHATAGALCCDKLNFFAAVCVAGHHTGLPDVGNQKMDASSDSTFFGKMKRVQSSTIWSSAARAALYFHRCPGLFRLSKATCRRLFGFGCSIPAWWTPIFWIRKHL